MAHKVTLDVDQFSDFVANVTIRQANGSLYNLSNHTATSAIRTSYDTSNATANFVCSIYDASNGALSMTLSKANSSLLNTWHSYFYDLTIIDTSNSNQVSRIMEGTINVLPGVTR